MRCEGCEWTIADANHSVMHGTVTVHDVIAPATITPFDVWFLTWHDAAKISRPLFDVIV
jgi:hypothetical protein